MTAAISNFADFSQFAELRSAAAQNDSAALRKVATQFEALFLQSMLKNMRETSLGDPLLGNSDQYEMYQGMMDQQLALEMASGRGVGFADMLVRQLGGEDTAAISRPDIPFPIRQRSAATLKESAWATADEFARDIWPHAQHAAKRLNVPAQAILAQAALETGWGKHVMPDREGNSSFNLFGIKAGTGWRGEQVTRQTLEFKAGTPRPERARFRAYENIAATFADYTEFLVGNPRYNGVRNHGADAAGFARSLQNSGYATDPNYAEKITNVLLSPTMRRVMSTLSADLNKSALRPITAQLSGIVR